MPNTYPRTHPHTCLHTCPCPQVQCSHQSRAEPHTRRHQLRVIVIDGVCEGRIIAMSQHRVGLVNPNKVPARSRLGQKYCGCDHGFQRHRYQSQGLHLRRTDTHSLPCRSHMSIHMSVHLSIHMSIHMSVHLFVHTCIRLTIRGHTRLCLGL